MATETEASGKPTPATGKTYRQAFCPCCGTAHGQKRLSYPEKGYYRPAPTVNYWEWLKEYEAEIGFGDDQPFGSIQQVGGGKGHSFQYIGDFGPEDDPDGYYPLVKARLLLAVRRWLKHGWLSDGEVRALLKPGKTS